MAFIRHLVSLTMTVADTPFFFEQAQVLLDWAKSSAGEAGLVGTGVGALAGMALGVRLGWKSSHDLEIDIAPSPPIEPVASARELDMETRIWTRPVSDRQLRLPSLSDRAMRVVAVCNLKGGVGKSTITANLALTLARMGRKVLVVDLDHQQSLTSLCLTPTQIGETHRSQIAVHTILENHSGAGDVIHQIAKRIRGEEDNFALVPAHHDLAEKEDLAMLEWLRNPDQRDVRFCLTAAIHGSRYRQWADYVLLDCPPRFTTASINGLAVSDFIIAPLIPDVVSAAAVPFFVRHLDKLRGVVGDGLRPTRLGLVANRCPARFLPEEAYWSQIIATCPEAWRPHVKPFTTSVPERVAFRDAAANGVESSRGFAIDLQPDLRESFRHLAAELETALHPPSDAA